MEASENEEEAREFEDDREELVPSYDEVYEVQKSLKITRQQVPMVYQGNY